MIKTTTQALLSIFFSMAVFAQKPSAGVFLNLSAGIDSEFLSHFSASIQGKQMVGLGEASHGTEDFYQIKSTLFKYMVEKHGFQGLAIEMDQEEAEKLNQFVMDKSVEVSTILKNYGLFNSKTLLEMLTWLKQYNQGRVDKVKILGFDAASYWGDPFSRDQKMADNFISKMEPKVKYVLWSHNNHLFKSNTWDVTKTGIKAMGHHLSKAFASSYYFLAFNTFQGQYNVVEDGLLKAYRFSYAGDALFYNPAKNNESFYFHSIPNIDNTQAPFHLANLLSNFQAEPKGVQVIPGKDFDAIIYIHNTSASVPIQ